MYKLNEKQRATQGERLKNLDLRLVVGYLKTALYWIAEHPQGPLPFVVEGHRTLEQEKINWAKGRTTPGPIVTYKQPGTSLHGLSPSRAIDIGFLDDKGQPLYEPELYQEFCRMWYEHSQTVIWGGNWQSFKDMPHFEVNPL